jgi:hypothetical protein
MQHSILLFVFTIVCKSDAWGGIGHSIIARLAQSQLEGATTSEWIQSLVPWHLQGNLSSMASWADDILYRDSNPTGYGNWQWSRPLHYINMPDWNCSYIRQRDCINDMCIDGAIRNYTKRLQTQFDDIQLKEALYFLIHYVGDIHQPLHTGFVSDRGANSIRGFFMKSAYLTNLHSLWDSGLITVRLGRNFSNNGSLYYDYIHDLMVKLPTIDQDDQIPRWIHESMNYVCEQIYFDENNSTMNVSTNFTLGEIYYQRSIPIVEQRLAQGGRRLGILLNRIANNRSKPPKEKLCTGTIVLIAVLAAEGLLALIIGIIVIVRKRMSK